MDPKELKVSQRITTNNGREMELWSGRVGRIATLLTAIRNGFYNSEVTTKQIIVSVETLN